MNFDGDDFVGLDEDFIGDGETDETTQPLSAYKERRIDANTRFSVKHHLRASQTPWSDRDAPRRVGLNDRAVQYMQIVDIYPNDDEVTVIMAGDVSGELVVELKIYPVLSDAIAESVRLGFETTEWIESDEADEYSITAQIDSSQLISPQRCLIAVSTRALSAGETVATTDPNSMDFIRDRYVMKPDGNFTRSELENSRVEFSRADSLHVFDILAVREDLVDGEIWCPLHPLDNNKLPADFLPDNTWDANLVTIPWIEPHGWWCEVSTNPDVATDQYAPKPSAEMIAQSAPIGQHVGKHPLNIDHSAFRARVVAAGPSHTARTKQASGGQVGDHNSTGTGFGWSVDDGVPRWSYSQATTDSDLVDHLGFRVDHESAIVRIDGLLSVIDLDSTGSRLWASGDLASGGDYPPMQGDDAYNRWVCDVPIRARATQLQDGDESWGDASLTVEESVAVRAKTWLVTPSVHRPFLRGMAAVYYAQWQDTFVDQPEPYRSQSEGMLIEQMSSTDPLAPRTEYRYLTPFRVDLAISDVSGLHPLRLELFCDEITAGDFEAINTDRSPSDIDISRHHVVLLHHTVSVIPVEAS